MVPLKLLVFKLPSKVVAVITPALAVIAVPTLRVVPSKVVAVITPALAVIAVPT